MDSASTEKAEVSRVENTSRAPSTPTGQELRDHPKVSHPLYSLYNTNHYRQTWNRTLKLMVLANLCFMVFCGNFYSVLSSIVIPEKLD